MRLRRRMTLWWGDKDTLDRASWIATFLMLLIITSLLLAVASGSL